MCKILRNFFANVYEIELPRDVSSSPIFNVSDLYPYHTNESTHLTTQEGTDPEVEWEVQLPKSTSIILEKILDTRMRKKTIGKEYYEYLLKWKVRPIEDSTWMTATMLSKSGVIIEDLMDRIP